MKKSFLVLAMAIIIIGLAVVCFRQSQRLAQHRVQVRSLQGELQGQAEQVGELKASKDYLNQQRGELLREVSQQSVQLSRQSTSSSPAGVAQGGSNASAVASNSGKPAADVSGFGKVFAKMMEDPDTRKFIREQQRMIMGQLYGPLMKQMGLAPEQAEKFSEMLADHATKSADRASSLFGGSTNRTEAFSAIAADSRAQEAQIKELLGDAHYAQYKEYQQTAGERMQLNMFKQQAGGDFQLSDPQTEQLLTIMREEKLNVAAAGQPVPGIGQEPGNLENVLNEGQSDALLQNLEGINQRVLERARTVLEPDQLNSFARFQTNQLQMMRMGMSMAQKLLNPDKTESAPVVQP